MLNTIRFMAAGGTVFLIQNTKHQQEETHNESRIYWTGNHGRPMAEHMVKAGLDVMVSDLNEKIVAELVAEGATAGSNKDLAEQCDVVEMILPNASIVKNVISAKAA